MDIKSLPKDVRTHLKSGANINSISQCVTELVLNSLDAKSAAIAARINLLTFRIQVVDNGKGITKSNMNLIGIRYMTSKCQSLADLKKIKRFGFRGEALASIRNMSKKITITSRSDNVENTYSKTYENGKWLEVELVKQRPSKGTTVTIEGFMHNLPVRQKRINQNLDMHEIKRNLENLAIIHPNVSFNLRNDATGKVVFQSNKTQTVSQALTNLYPNISIDDLLEIKITKNKISVSGLISKNPSTNSKLQFIYLNKRPIISQKIQNLVNSLLLKSLIYQKPSTVTRSEKNLNFVAPIDKTEHPIYVINIRCPYSEVDLTLSPSKKTVEFKQWNVVLKCVEKAVVKLLEHENLISTNSTKEEVDLPTAPSFKSQFGVSQIQGAVKSITAKRKIVKNATELPQKYSKTDKVVNYSNTTIDSGANISAIEERGNKVDNHTTPGTSSRSSFNGIIDYAKILTSTANNEEEMGQRRKFKVISSNKDNNYMKKNCSKNDMPITDGANDLFPKTKPDKPRNRHNEDNLMKTTKRETCFKTLPTITKYYKDKNVKGRPMLLGKIELDMPKHFEVNYNQNEENAQCGNPDKNLGKSKNGNKKNIKTNTNKGALNIVNITSDDVLNSLNSNTNIKTTNEKPKNNPQLIKLPKELYGIKTQNQTNHNQNIYSTNPDNNIPANIFDKHKNTQSLVLNSELNGTRPNPNTLLNSTINTNILVNQEKGKELIMDMFLKSSLVFPNEAPDIKDNIVKTVVVETTKQNVIAECRNVNTTMMTVSCKIMSKKTIVTNSVHPVCNSEESVLEGDQNLAFDSNSFQKLTTKLGNNCKEIQGALNVRPKINQCRIPKEKMISKCIQTTMIEHQKEFKIDFNCVTQAGSNTNSKFTFYNSVPQTDKYNITFSKYFEKSRRNEQNKPKQYCFPESCIKNDFEFNKKHHNFYDLEKPMSFGIGETNFNPNFNENYISNWCEQKRATLNFRNCQPLHKIPIPRFGTDECLQRSVPFHACGVLKDHFRNFPADNRKHNCNTFNGNNNKIFSNYDLYGGNFRKPINKYSSDYNFDFSNLNASDKPYKHFVEQKYNFEKHYHQLPFVRRTNASRNYNIENCCADVTYDITVPLYRSYNPDKLNRLGQHSNYYQSHFVNDEPLNDVNNYITANNRHEEIQYRTRNKMEKYLHPEETEKNYRLIFNNTCNNNNNKNHGQLENGVLQDELYKSIIRDYGQNNCFQSVNDKKIDGQVTEGINKFSKKPKLEENNLYSEFARNILLQSKNKKPKFIRGETDRKQKYYSPFFQKPARKDEHHMKLLQHNKQQYQHKDQIYHQYRKMKNVENRKNSFNQNLFTVENQDDDHCVSPFFRKISNNVPIIESKRTCLANKNQKNVPIKEILTNHENIEPMHVSKCSQTDDHQGITFLVSPTKRIVVPSQQNYNHKSLLLEQAQQQQFFSSKQNGHLLNRQNDFFFLEPKENQAEKLNRKKNQYRPQIQECRNKFVRQHSNQTLQNSFQEQKNKQYEENKLQQNAMFFENYEKDVEQPQADFLFSVEKPENNWQFIPPCRNTNFHQKSKLSLKKFNTEPPQQKPKDFFHAVSNANSCVPQTHFNFQQKSEPAIKKFFTEPSKLNYHQNLEECPKRCKLDLSSQSKPPFVDLTTPKYDKEIEYSFMTPNINKSSTIDDTIEKISLDYSENFELSNLKEMEENTNLTVCSKNFKPALSSTRIDAVEENYKRKSVYPFTLPIEIEEPEITLENCGLDSDVIGGTPTRNFEHFFVPSLNKSKPQQRHENNCSSKKTSSVLNISINAIKKSKLIEKGMADDRKLNRKSESEESEPSNINFVNSDHLLNNVNNVTDVKNQNENGIEEAPAEDEWIQNVNTFGSVFYIHKRTGMTSTSRPKQESNFNLIKRIEFVPKGLSPIFIETKKIDTSLSPISKKSLHAAILENYENELNTIKWSNYIYDYNNANAFFEELYREKTKQFECHIPNINLNEFPKSMVKLCNKMHAQSFTKDIFSELEIIGQLDNKFIITMLKSKKLIVLFDQHAVHERVRLEQLINDYTETENETDIIKFKSTKCREKIIITLTSSDVTTLTNFKKLFQNVGLQYTIFENGIEITHIPTCIYNKLLKEKNREIRLKNINSLIHEQIAMVTSTRGVSSKMPTVLQNIINSEACRGAVKFGDQLTTNECEKHIKELSLCKLPFQCAHGRPTLVPVVSVKQNFDTKQMKPHLNNLKI